MSKKKESPYATLSVTKVTRNHIMDVSKASGIRLDVLLSFAIDKWVKDCAGSNTVTGQRLAEIEDKQKMEALL